MKRKTVLLIVIYIVILLIFGLTMHRCVDNQEKLTLNGYLGENHAGKNSVAQLFYTENI